jgi:hypothetical protein
MNASTMLLSPSIRSLRRVLTVAVAFLAVNPKGYSQTTPAAKQLLESMIKALGGNQFLEVKEVRTAGRFFTFRRDEIATSDIFVDYVKFPDMERTEFGREKERTIQINHGEEGWIIAPSREDGDPELREQTPAETENFLTNFQTSFDYVVRFVAQNPNSSLLITGTELVDFKRADILEIRDPEKNLMRISVDRETRLPLKVQTRLAGESTVREEVYANWHAFDGVMTPLMTVRYNNGVKTMEIRASEAEYNSGLAESLFAPPADSN